jgi:hypothetical protein
VTQLFSAALELQRFCGARNWPHCFIGGLAVQRWGDPRVTKDADLTLLTGFGGEELYVDALLGAFEGRRDDAREFALRQRVLLLRHSSGVPFDISLAALPFEEGSVARSSLWPVAPGESLRTCSAEDLVVYKSFASRGQDWVDVETVLMRQAARLDGALILRELVPLAELKEAPDIVVRLRAMLSKYKVRTG